MIFKEISDDDRVYQKTDESLTDLFNTNAHIKKTVSGWNYTKNSSFTDEPSITGSVYFVENDQFFVTYANETGSSDMERYLPWNSLMSSLGVDWNFTENRYDFYVNDNRITEAVVISFNPENLKEGLDDDNFFIVMSGSSGNEFTDINGNGNYNVSQSLVLAPYYLNNQVDDDYETGDGTTGYSNKMNPVYELRTSDSNTFMTYNTTTESININWNDGNISSPMGLLYTELGLVIIFPELVSNTNVKNTIQSAGDRALFALNSIMYMAGYTKEKISKEVLFMRFYNREFNYTTNPSAYNRNNNRVELDRVYIDNPRVFITKAGFYNDKNECLAVASLSQPYEKSITTELNIKVEIDL